MSGGYASFGSRAAREVVEVSHDLRCLDRGGFWGVAVTFENEVTCVRFAEVTTTPTSSGQIRRTDQWASRG